ncbi:hypothetical protein [uncultured Sphingomonas sp.]|uniref:hypothetical protein n=1 Tax=uncultured Sphingomonas sp. TaxID=158754 RepID=UPI0035CA05FC
MSFHFPERSPARATWLVTLADLALLLVGFFVLLQAHPTDGRALAGALRDRFGDAGPAAPAARRAMPVGAAAIDGFLPGSAALPRSPRAVLDWAGDAARDPRTTLTITGGTDGSAADVDPVSGSGAVLAADRARALAAVLAPVLAAAHVAPSHILVATTTTPGRRAATVTVGFTGNQP